MARHSTGDYPPDWANIARGVKEAAGWKCVRCGHEHDPAAGYYAYHLLGEDLSREEVEARMEALLAAGQPWRTQKGA